MNSSLKATRWAITLLVIGLCIGTARNLNAQPLPHIVRSYHGAPTMIVDGEPFLVMGAQCDIWRSTRQDAKTIQFFDAYKEMHATTVGIGIPWSKVEIAEDQYDFKFVDWFILRARERSLRLGLNLFDTNVCGKVQEGSDGSAYPVYTPAYILSQPEKYHRMKLPYPYKYAAGGPPMCPNDPATLAREQKYVRVFAEHLKRFDPQHTVILLQLNNEFYYQQWEGDRPAYGSAAEKSVRCQCDNCNALWNSQKPADGESFMFHSFALYARALSDTIASEYRLPMYLNSPWWPAYLVPVFLDTCPNIDMVGIDGVFSAKEPAIFSESQRSRNLPFAAENPTENSETRLNLDVVPYYTALVRPGLGNLLWECGPPHTLVDDPTARKRYGDTLAPLAAAMHPICQARAADSTLTWFALRDIPEKLKTDEPGNYLDQSGIKTRFGVKHGTEIRMQNEAAIAGTISGIPVSITGSTAGTLMQISQKALLLVTSAGTLHLNTRPMRAEYGHYQGAKWISDGPAEIRPDSGTWAIPVSRMLPIRITFS